MSSPRNLTPPYPPLLETRDVKHIFPDGTEALRGVDFTLAQGEFVLIVGANGSGKTVFVRHLNALYRPSSGKVLLEGEPVEKDIQNARRKVGLVFQDADSQIVAQTVREDIAFGPQNLGLPRDEIKRRVEHAMELLDLGDLAEHRPHLLSGGEKRRLAIAGVLALEPEVLILDEPFSNLDYGGVVRVLRHIVDLHSKGQTLILVSHDIEKACAHADRLVVFSEGRISENGEPEGIIPRLGRYGVRIPPTTPRPPAKSTWLEDYNG